MQEKRISVRTQLLCVHASVTEEEGLGWTNIVVNDISDGGLSFTSKKSFPIDQLLKFEGDVSDYVRGMDITCDIRIVFCEKADGKYTYGARFVNLTTPQRTSLSIFIELMVTKYPNLLDQDA